MFMFKFTSWWELTGNQTTFVHIISSTLYAFFLCNWQLETEDPYTYVNTSYLSFDYEVFSQNYLNVGLCIVWINFTLRLFMMTSFDLICLRISTFCAKYWSPLICYNIKSALTFNMLWDVARSQQPKAYLVHCYFCIWWNNVVLNQWHWQVQFTDITLLSWSLLKTFTSWHASPSHVTTSADCICSWLASTSAFSHLNRQHMWSLFVCSEVQLQFSITLLYVSKPDICFSVNISKVFLDLLEQSLSLPLPSFINHIIF